MINNDTLECNDSIEESRHKQVLLATSLMTLVYGLYALFDSYFVSESVLAVTNPYRLAFNAFLFFVLLILFSKHITHKIAYIGLMVVPIVITITSMVMFQKFDNIYFYLTEISILLIWTLNVSGLRFKHSLTTSLVLLVITFYSLLIYHSQSEVSLLFYLLLFVIVYIIALSSAYFIEKLTLNLCVKTHEYQELSMTDELTELPSRAKFDFVIKNELERSRRYNYKFGLLMIEIDDFKLICDNFGTEVRDDLLIVVSSLITDQVRSTDIEIRWSEYEFVVVCLELDIVQLTKIANSILQTMREYDFGRLGRVSLSIGATINKVSDNETSIVNRVNQALFKAQHEKGNSVESL